MSDLIERNAAIDALNVGAELLKRVLDDADVVGAEREKYEWGLGLIESYISDMKELPPAQPDSKTAYWGTHIFDGIMGGRPRAYMCGCCNFISLARTNYCPNCGAKMEVNK